MQTKHLLPGITLGIFLLASPMPLWADELPAATASDAKEEEAPEGKTHKLERMKVQAQKRSENIQEVPISMTGIFEDRIQESRIYDFIKLDLAVPNLSFHNYGCRTNHGLLNMRGLATSNNSQDPTVGVYVDEVPITDILSLNSPALFNLQRVEVLRGPQSTLWGVNTEGGAVLIYTKDPTNEWIGTINGEIGTNQTYLGRASVSGPLIDNTLYLGLAAAGESSDGYVTNVYDDSSPSHEDAFGARGKLIWTPNDKLEVKFYAYADRIEGETGNVQVPYDYSAYNTLYNSNLGEFDVALDDGTNGATRDSNTQALRISYKAPWFDIISMTSRRDMDLNATLDTDMTDYPGIRSTGLADKSLTDYSQELRFVSPQYKDLPLKWVAGLFYLNQKRYARLFIDYKFMNYATTFSHAENTGYNLAAFGQASYRFWGERLGLTAGIRLEQAERSMDRNDDIVQDYSDSATETEWLPRLVLDYMIAQDVMAYASASKGWRNGGLNPYAPSRDLIPYDKEVAWNYEVGLKSAFFDNRLRLNASFFYMGVRDYQETVYTGDGTASYFGNAEKVTLKGFELEAEARPWAGWLFIASLGFSDAVYDDYQLTNTINLEGNKVADTPEWEFTGIAQYTFPTGLYLRGEFYAAGKKYLTPENDLEQDPFQLYNARIGYKGESIEVYIFGENLTDKLYYLNATHGFDGLAYGPVGPGRIIGAGASYLF